MNVRAVVENAWLTVVARFAIFIATFVALPVAGWLLTRAAGTVDHILEATQKIELKLVNMDGAEKLFAEQIQALQREQMDHEQRLRELEAYRAQGGPARYR